LFTQQNLLLKGGPLAATEWVREGRPLSLAVWGHYRIRLIISAVATVIIIIMPGQFYGAGIMTQSMREFTQFMR